MKNDAFTDPVAIRSLYQTRGRNVKLNVARAESLGVAASQVSPTQAKSPVAGGTGGTGVTAMPAGQIPDPTLYSDDAANDTGRPEDGSV